MQNVRRQRRGFTLIELLVVIGILAVLAGLFLPMLVKAMRAGRRSRTASDLNAIAIALEAYRTDFGDYPRVPQAGTGFAILGQALIGPGPAVMSNMTPIAPYQAGTISISGGVTQLVALRDTTIAPTAGSDWAGGASAAGFPYADGADGPGFRTINDTSVNNIKGKVYGPYLDPSKFKLRGLAILDNDGYPIMYFPASPSKLNLAVNNAKYVWTNPLTLPLNNAGPMFNVEDNGVLACSMVADFHTNGDMIDMTKTLPRMQVMMGDLNHNGYIDNGETAATTAPFVLWSAGSDGFFGPLDDITQISGTDLGQIRKAVNRCDDVTNFTFAQ